MLFVACFEVDILVLTIAQSERTLPIPSADDKLIAIASRRDRLERDRVVIILPRCDLAVPLAEVEANFGASFANVDRPEVGVHVAGCELLDEPYLRRDIHALAFRKRRSFDPRNLRPPHRPAASGLPS